MRKKGFSLIELIVTVAVISVISTMAVTPMMADVPAQKVKSDIIIVEQAIKVAQSTANKTSSTIVVDFAMATSNNGDDGGLIRIRDLNSNTIASFSMTRNVVYNTGGSTIANNELRFDYRGQPVDSTGDAGGFTSANNTISISYVNKGSRLVSKNLEINPFTGSIKIN